MDAEDGFDALAFEREMGLTGDYADEWKGPDSVEFAPEFGRPPASMLELLTCDLGSMDHATGDVCAHEIGARYWDLLDAHEEYRLDRSWIDEDAHRYHRASVIHGLHRAESLATWLVLKSCAPDVMWSCTDAQRRELFLTQVYGQPEQHEFFSVRERVIAELAKDGLLERRLYVRDL